MKISYNWLKKYISIDMDIKKISNILTDIGLPIKSIKKITDIKDYILDIEITPNRTDAMSHYGIARDLYTVLKFRGYKVHLSKPIIDNEIYFHNNKYIQIFLEENKKCIRYSVILLFKIKIDTSPNWLISSLESIGIKSINNIMDIIHYVMYELGIPIHVFDLDKIIGNKIFIKNAQSSMHLQSIDNKEIIVNKKDLIISDSDQPLSIAGIINNINYNIHIKTKNIFLGIACFDPIIIRIFGKKHLIKTDVQYLLEKGIDPNLTIYALRRASFLIKEITNTKKNISNIIDVYPHPITFKKIKLRYKKIINTIGVKISKKKIKNILSLLEINIHSENDNYLLVIIPTYRIDVKREIDLIEEILRIYGINKIKISNQIKVSPIPIFFYRKENEIRRCLSQQLVCYGFQEIISNTIIKNDQYSSLLNSFFKREEIKIINPLTKNYNSMRSSLLFGMIDCIKYNYNRIFNKNFKFFEIGKIYYRNNNKFLEKTYLSISIFQIIQISENNFKINNYPFFYLKGIIEQIFQKSGIFDYTQICSKHPLLEESISILLNNKKLAELGIVKNNFFKKKNIFYAEIDWEYLVSIIQDKKIIYIPFSKYPTSKRDLSLLVEKNVSFEEINQLIKNKENHIIKKIQYDLYEGINIPKSKKSYTISFFFESQEKTLTDNIINDSMKKIEYLLKNKLKAEIRNK
ncbi:phenylalanine--tRNA ligase subunit beta [Blattabacterium cuenoti]|uniref:phenylalanine--tRNA ligase subunit beta n=1 Tax=Blattabacterium cuenoti TaxID=1653831 RepID=UPI00163C2A78|nr:phenylalanine--tRNA ligase subunit beta [Blattabacterium cuenoti]